MTVPNGELAMVEREKIVDYLLNPAHPGNGGKAAFFFAHGFRREEWAMLATALIALARSADAAKELASPTWSEVCC